MTDPIVVLDGVSRAYHVGLRTTPAVRNATCTIAPGQQIALTGPSGSGKSTLLHLFGGLDLPTSGVCTWPALGPRESLRPDKVMDVFQAANLLPPLTALENVRLPLLLGGWWEREATALAEAALAWFGVAHLADKLPEELSGGQAQRVAIARAVAGRPALVLADEPTGQLDSATANDVLTILLARLTEIGAAAVIATHDPRLAARCATNWTMRDGVLEGQNACSLVSG